MQKEHDTGLYNFVPCEENQYGINLSVCSTGAWSWQSTRFRMESSAFSHNAEMKVLC